MRKGFLWIFCLTILTTLTTLTGRAQYAFLHYQIENGLSNNAVQCILQDTFGFMWFGTNDGLTRFDGKHFRIFNNKGGQENSLGNNFIRTLFEDHEKKIWVGTNKGIYIYDPFTELFSPFTFATQNDVTVSSRINKIISGGDNYIWIATQGQGVFIFNVKTKQLIQNSQFSSFATALLKAPDGYIYLNTQLGGLVCFSPEGKYIRSYEVNNPVDQREIRMATIHFHNQSLWFSVNTTGLSQLDLRTGLVHRYTVESGNKIALNIRTILSYAVNKLLIGTDNGIYVFDTDTKVYGRINKTSNQPGLSDQSINDIYKDREGGIWFATHFGGVNYLPRSLNPFEHHLPDNQPKSIEGKAISQFCEDGKGNIWIATEDGGLSYYDAVSHDFTTYKPQPFMNSISDFNIHALLLDGNKLWIGTNSKGIDILDIRSGKFINFQHIRGDTTSINDNSVYALYKDSHGDIYVGTMWGLSKYNRQNNKFIGISQIGNFSHVFDIKEDSRGYLWLACYNNGIFRCTLSKHDWKYYSPEYIRNGRKISGNNFISLFEDSRHNMWFGTDGNGMYAFDYRKERFIGFDTTNQVLPNKVIYRIEEDANKNFWLSTNAGLLCVEPVTKKVIYHFTSADGLQSNQFNYRSSLHASNGLMYFGGINGFNVFDPLKFGHNQYMPAVVLTNLYVNNREVFLNDGSQLLPAALHELRSLHLNSRQNTLAFDFAALSFQSPLKNLYAYKLDGFDKDWTDIGSNERASYTNLSPGKYLFMVKASNSDGLWTLTPATLEIIIHPPFYRTGFAYATYFIFLAVLVYYSLKYGMNKLKEKHERVLKETIENKEKDALRSKVEFFTNIAHEIRTPLSLIKVPLDYLVLSGKGNEDIKTYLHTISRNTDALLELMNQLLDFRKTDETDFVLKITQCHVSVLLEEIFDQFITTANIQHIQLELVLPDKPLVANADADVLKKIINNLLNNALKYAKDRVELRLTVFEKSFEVTVTDNGKGIEKEEEARIFDPFYQAKNSKPGTGIGLSFAKLLATKHEGELIVDRTASDETSFIVRIPLLEVSYNSPEIHPVTNIVKDVSKQKDTFHLMSSGAKSDAFVKLLIVEDNMELLSVTAGFFRQEYEVFTAFNGKEALALLNKENIDLVVSDLMMPEMDGYELCEYVKNDPQWCHIPFIILSAKTTISDKISGFDLGAEVYMEKPFSLELLASTIQSLLGNRKKLRDTFARSPFQTPVNEIAISKKDQQFVQRLNCEIEKYIPDADFYIDTMAEQMFMSRSNFYRKIKGIFGISPNDYLRIIRLKRAAELLSKAEYRINELYQLVGFNSPAYFSKCFKEQFGMTIREYSQFVRTIPKDSDKRVSETNKGIEHS
jgi:signal transduction histidine kinase/ligand-binding sensor domain-containing protein/CheY-like chemotaxis protein/AraC-like DNA-binding protein